MVLFLEGVAAGLTKGNTSNSVYTQCELKRELLLRVRRNYVVNML